MVTQFMDKEIFCAHILEHESAMYRAARSILSNPEDVEDAVQEAICSAFAHRGDLRDPQRFKPWLLRIVVNTCYELCRKQKKVIDLGQVEGVLEAPNADPTEAISLWQAVLALPESLRTAVTLFYYRGLHRSSDRPDPEHLSGGGEAAAQPGAGASADDFERGLRYTMDHFDEQLKQRARQEPFQTPPSYRRRVEETCAALEEDSPVQPRSHGRRRGNAAGVVGRPRRW